MTDYNPVTYKIGNCKFEKSSVEKDNSLQEIQLFPKRIEELDFFIQDIEQKSDFTIWLDLPISSKSIDIQYNILKISEFRGGYKVIISVFKYFSDSFDKWELKWNMKSFFDLAKLNLSHFDDLVLLNDNTSEESIDYNIAVINHEELKIHQQYMIGIELLDKIYRIVKLELGGLEWNNIYETNEKIFSTELVEPLLRKMKFDSVRYNHGIKEYGKDFICSYIDNFKIKKYVGIQIKSGNVSGKVNSQIDELLGQIDDAFSMPFKEIGDKSGKHISNFYIIISGHFTDNAKDKINEKIPSNLTGNISFIDKSGVLDLIKNINKE